MSYFTKEYHNPLELIKNWWPNADISHITYKPSMRWSEREYWRIAQSGGDGTMLFTIQMLQELLLPLINKTTYFKETAPKELEHIKDIKYTIGKVRHAIVFGNVELKCGGKYPGQRERVRVPIQCEYVYKRTT